MKDLKKILALVLAFALILAPTLPLQAREENLQGSVVILHTNDVHGAVSEYAKVTALKNSYEERGAQVLLMDAGDFIQGSIYVSESGGKSAVSLMNAVGYDVVAMGNHELDFTFDNLLELSKDFNFDFLCATAAYEDGKLPFAPNRIIETKAGIKIGVFGVNTPESQTKANPKNSEGLKFANDAETIEICKSQVKQLKDEGCDFIICLGHMGINLESTGHRSVDIIKEVPGIDLFIDGHSHSTLNEAETALKELSPSSTTNLTSTGAKLQNIGVVTITPNNGKMDVTCQMIPTKDLPKDEKISEMANKIISDIDREYGKVFAHTEVKLEGTGIIRLTKETNLGDLVADSMRWKFNELTGIDAAAIINGGAIRDSINIGEISKKDILNVLPFYNTLALVEVTGKELLNALEVSTSSLPDPTSAFPQVSGIEYTVNTGIPYDEGPEYPGSTYKSPASIGRVTINTVCGKEFDINDKYTLIVSNFMSSGGDTYYEFKKATNNYDSGLFQDQVLSEYIEKELSGVISEKMYPDKGNRITILGEGSAPKTDIVSESANEISSEDNRTYTVKKNDNLWKIAVICYSDGGKYMAIYNANKDILKNPNLIYPGQKLKIPG